MSATLAQVARRTEVTLEDVREIASQLPRSYEVFVYGRVKFRVGVAAAYVASRELRGLTFHTE